MITVDFCVHTDNKACTLWRPPSDFSVTNVNDIIPVIATFPDKFHVEVTFNM